MAAYYATGKKAGLLRPVKKCTTCGVSIGRRNVQCRPCFTAKRRKEGGHCFICEVCGVDAHRSPGGKTKEMGYKNRFCSQVCRSKSATPQGFEPKHHDFCKVTLNTCRQCGRAWCGKRSKLYCSAVCFSQYKKDMRRDAFIPKAVRCKGCGESFMTQFGRGFNKREVFCSSRCSRKLAKREYKKKFGRDYRSRARTFGVHYEPVNRIKVFERDGWSCQVCGKPTPKARRGTRYTNAPELDHRIPLALGGPHTYDNVQCACRSCNSIKGAHTVVGQLPLLHVDGGNNPIFSTS